MRHQNLAQYLWILTLTFCSFSSLAQDPVQNAIQYLEANRTNLQLTNEDILDIRITDHYQSQHNQIHHIYFRQQYNNIEILNANVNFNALSNEEILNMGGQFVSNLKEKIKGVNPQISAKEAVESALFHLNMESINPIIPKGAPRDPLEKYYFEKGNIALEDMTAKLGYYWNSTDEVQLIWDVSIYEKDASDWWQVQVNALTGAIINQHNLVLHCDFGKPHAHHHASEQNIPTQEDKVSIFENISNIQFIENLENTYQVYNFPVESPTHGNRTMVTSPWENAGLGGTLGWHDDGTSTYTTSKGNNTDAYEDHDNSNSPSNGDASRVEGGGTLEFDFPIDLNQSPLNNHDAIVTNLFYWNNLMHDIWYQYGFDENSGNFQEDNMGRGGNGSDYVYAEAQDDVNNSSNNANFSTPSDGGNPRMQMYLWSANPSVDLIVNEPPAVVGNYSMIPANFGGEITSPLVGDVVEADPVLACEALTNAGALTGKIALIDRGSCEFGVKCLNAENAGAIAVIVCNNVAGSPISMGGGAQGGNVTIPAVMIGLDDCTAIRAQLNNNLNVTLEAIPGATFEIETPNPAAGNYEYAVANFGAPYPTTALSASLILADDGTVDSTHACNPLINAAAMNGNIALIDRGSCQFGLKCLNAQNAGAIAVVVCNNNADPPFSMGPGADGANVTIPCIMISEADCIIIKNNLPATAKMEDNSPPDFDSDLDNGIIAHEYGHGISNRLTGGPNTGGCLSNAEQMGEGWSDFFGIWMTIEMGDAHDDVRGVGTHVLGQSPTGSGIRPSPYTTNMNINASTYGDITNTTSISQPHGIGFLWCTMIWDLNWALIKEYAFDPDIYNATGTAGNLVAAQLVMDGLKIQPCSPGFVDGRNAILLADTINSGGINGDIIWNVFARRGLGYSADQGGSNSRTDGAEAFDLPPDVPFMDEDELFGDVIAALPIELTHFSAIPNNAAKQIELFWATTTELNNKGFEIQIATEDSTWETIGWQDGKQESLHLSQYEFIDKQVIPNVDYFYRLKQIDYSGEFQYSKIESAMLEGESDLVHLYPNPNHGNFFIEFKNQKEGYVDIAIYSLTGKLVEAQHLFNFGNGKIALDLSAFAKGTYLIKIEMEGKVVNRKVIVD